jgi:phosphate uptake regulator
MAQTVGPNDQFPDEVGRLASDTTELGIVVGDMFRYACAGLFGQEPETARFVAESRAWVTQAANSLDLRVRLIIQRYRPSGDDMRRIVELQQAASQLARIADRSSHISDQALILRGEVDQALASVAPDASSILYTLISLVYEQMRGVFLVTAAREMAQARTLVASHAEVTNYYQALRVRLNYSIKNEPMTAPPLQRVQMVATDMLQIGQSVVNICEATLFTPSAGAI